VLLLVAAFLAYRSAWGGGNPYSLDRLSEDVVIKDRETGEEWVIKRGRMEAMLRDRGSNLDPNVGLPNPNTGKMTGFPKSEWESTIDRLKADHDATVAEYGGRVPSGGARAKSSTPKNR
jgi:hypothetical protein